MRENVIEHPSVLVIGNYRASITVVRSLAETGYYVICGDDGSDYSYKSRGSAETWHHKPIEHDPSSFMAALLSFLADRPEVTLVFPVHEDTVSLLAQTAHQLPKCVRVVMPQPEVVSQCLDKIKMLNFISSLDVPTKPFALAKSISDIRRFSNSSDVPIVIRPIGQNKLIGGRKALIVGDPVELVSILSRWPSDHPSLLIQQYAHGERHNIYFVADKGTVIASGRVKILRTDRIDGTGFAVEGITLPPDEALDSFVERIVQHLRYNGLGCAQFHFDHDTGDVCFLELNPRLGANFAITHASGLPLAPLACAIHRQEDIQTFKLKWIIGLRYAWLYGDLMGLIRAMRDPEISLRQRIILVLQVIRSQFRADIHLMFSWSDPLPALCTYFFGVVRFLRSPRSYLKVSVANRP